MNCFSLYALFCFCLCLYAANHYPSNSILSDNKPVLNLEARDYMEQNTNVAEGGRGARRLLLGGPGSSPPRCASKCGGCMPCRPVHVPVPPGTRVTMEYYPEAWRCKCGNKLYMP